MTSTTTTPVLTPTEVLRAAVAVIRTRGYFQPLSRQWEPQVPTAMDVEKYVFGWGETQPGDRRRFGAQYAEGVAEAADVEAWCAQGDPGNAYRATLARIVAAGRATHQDIAVLSSAVGAYRKDRRRAAVAAETAADAERSRHQGTKGERVEVTATVAVVLDFTRSGPRAQPRYLVKLRDADHQIYVWEARTADVPTQGQRVQVAGTVDSHGQYRGVAQTGLIRCRWTSVED